MVRAYWAVRDCVWPLLTGRPLATYSPWLVMSEAAGTRIWIQGPVWSSLGHYETGLNDKEGQTRIDKEHANLRWPQRQIDRSVLGSNVLLCF